MWKRLFIVLAAFDLLAVIAGLLVWNSLPQSGHTPSPTVPVPANAPTVQVDIGADAINAYLAYAIAHDPEVGRVLEAASVQFGDTWVCDFAVKVLDRALPMQFVVTPIVQNGNLILHVDSAQLSFIPIPRSVVLSVLDRASLPSWVQIDGSSQNIALNFTERPPKPFAVRVVQYSPAAQKLSLNLAIPPQTLSQHAP
ncbi:MAG: DUF2140 family protein [Alicyclobacillus mali]|uniref:DUF2140 family protein n=1 Tax=Alicyclobacillus mali (ex Roth et al. 2021) TaxID=1123961 RepID=UPI0023F0570A|nr:DUF2140 family protein [Alicyclobacillus mali (ex Roth et al. 2021)]MCL6489282.1 DUF2140 family protein [Alicyclobacillus mali (ex Roth et al. 2021)]